MEDLRASILLSAQRALLGAIGPKMRAISVEWIENKNELSFFTLHCAVESQDAGEDLDAIQIACTEIISDFWKGSDQAPAVRCEEKMHVIPINLKAEIPGVYIFHRREFWSEKKKKYQSEFI